MTAVLKHECEMCGQCRPVKLLYLSHDLFYKSLGFMAQKNDVANQVKLLSNLLHHLFRLAIKDCALARTLEYKQTAQSTFDFNLPNKISKSHKYCQLS